MSGSGLREVLARLNGLRLGELGQLDSELDRASEALARLGQGELRERVEAARRFLEAGDLREFRRALATVTSRLGHLK